MKKELNSNKMGEKNTKILLITMALPAILSMTIQSLYNIIDSVYISKYSYAGQTALSYAFPMQVLMMAFAFGIAVGTNVIIARSLGEKNQNKANITANTGIRLSLLMGFIFFILSFFIPHIFMQYFTNDPEVIEYGTTYLSIVIMFSVFFFLEITLTRSIQSTGYMIIPMIAQIVGALVNIILDPIFIFTLDMGIRGAAIATIIGQGSALIVTTTSFLYRKYDFHYTIKNYKFDFNNAKEIILLGIPITASNLVMSIATVFLNQILNDYHEAAVNVLGIYFKLQSFVFMPIFGLNQGLLPLLSYNYGKRDQHRYLSLLRFAFFISFSITLISFGIFIFFPKELILLFNDNPNNLSIGIPALRIIAIGFIPAIFSITNTSIFQSFAQGFKSLLLILFRQLIILVPLALILGIVFNLETIWYAFPIAEILAAITFSLIAFLTIKNKFTLQK